MGISAVPGDGRERKILATFGPRKFGPLRTEKTLKIQSVLTPVRFDATPKLPMPPFALPAREFKERAKRSGTSSVCRSSPRGRPGTATRSATGARIGRNGRGAQSKGNGKRRERKSSPAAAAASYPRLRCGRWQANRRSRSRLSVPPLDGEGGAQRRNGDTLHPPCPTSTSIAVAASLSETTDRAASIHG